MKNKDQIEQEFISSLEELKILDFEKDWKRILELYLIIHKLNCQYEKLTGKLVSKTL